MEHDPFYKIEIKEGFFAHEFTNISPARKSEDSSCKYEQNKEQMISVREDHLLGFHGMLLDKYYCEEIQLPYYSDTSPYEKYDPYGWNFYTPQQIRSLLADLQEFVDAVSVDPFDSRYVKYLEPYGTYEISSFKREDFIPRYAAQLTDFYSRFIARMNIMLDNMGDYDLIMFVGP